MGCLFGQIRHPLPESTVDFGASPSSPDETNVVNQFQEKILTPSSSVISRLEGYQDAQALIAASISNPSEDTKTAAFNAVLPNVQFQSEVFDFTSTLVDSFIDLLDFVLNQMSPGVTALSVLIQCPAVVKSFAECLQIILKFDAVILTLPKLLGDLAYFRRSASRVQNSEEYDSLMQKTSEITMFFGTSNPVLSRLISSLGSHFGDDAQVVNFLSVFASLIDLYTSSLFKDAISEESQKILALNGITGATLLYDFSSANGAFNSTVPIAIGEAMNQLCVFEPQECIPE